VPKQYKPDIVQPAYLIVIPAPGYSSLEIADYAIRPFQKKLNEISGIEHISSSAKKDYGTITVKFE
jgi:multidrug efflux pump